MTTAVVRRLPSASSQGRTADAASIGQKSATSVSADFSGRGRENGGTNGTLEIVAVKAEAHSAQHVLPDGEFTSRLCVGRPDVPSSGVFRIWSPKGKSDVYASMRGIAGQVKISLHESGSCIAGLTKEFAAKEVGAVVAMGGERHQSKWMRLRHTGERIVTPLQFIVPESQLRLRSQSATESKVERIDPPVSGRSIVISCIFSGQCLSNDNWPGRRNRTRLVGSKLLPNGEKFWLIWQDCPTTDLEREILREAEAHAATTDMVSFSRPKDDTGSPERTLIFREFPEDRCLIVMDAALLGGQKARD